MRMIGIRSLHVAITACSSLFGAVVAAHAAGVEDIPWKGKGG